MTIGISDGIWSPPGGGGGGDPTGNALLASIMDAAGAAPLIISGAEPLDDDTSMGKAGYIPNLPWGTAIVALTADRAFDVVFKTPDTAAPGNTAIISLGAYSGPNAWGFLRSDGTNWGWYNPAWSSNVTLVSNATARNKWVRVHGKYTHATATTTLYTRVDGGVESTATLAQANGGAAAADQVFWGGNGSSINGTTSQRLCAFALYSIIPADTHRADIDAALGW